MQSVIAYWSVFTLTITGIYTCLIVIYWYFWKKIPVVSIKKNDRETFVTVIIVGRNEALNIPFCLRSINLNEYPLNLYEIIFVDDHSEDDSLNILHDMGIPNLRVIELKDHIQPDFQYSFKKMGIEIALQQAKGTLILQTDADTRVGKDWIKDHTFFYEHQRNVFTAAPVFIETERNWLAAFQKLDFLVNMGLTGAGIQSGWHYMANGANMSYQKNAYQTVNLSATKKLASGDDMFLVQELAKKYPGKIRFLKSPGSCVMTKPEPSINDFLKQRIRWASKTGKYKSPSLLITAAFVFLVNLVWLANFFLIFWHPAFLYLFSLVVLMKWVVDYSFIKSISSFYKQKVEPWEFLISGLLYPFYFLIIGFLAIFVRKYSWKGRKIS